MANRFPLVVDTDDGNKLKELPAGDLLNLANSGIANLTELSVAGALTSSTLNTTGNATLGGNLSITGTLTVDGDSIGVQVQSNWNETDVNSPAYIRNKPTISSGSTTLAGLTDTFISNPVNDEVLVYFNGQWVNAEGGSGIDIATVRQQIYQSPANPTGGGIDVTDNPPSGRGSLTFGKTPGNSDYGQFTYTPPNALIKGQQDNISELINDSVYVNEAFLTTVDPTSGRYLKSNLIQGFGRLSTSVDSNGLVQILLDDSDLLTAEVDTLASVTARGAITTTALEADAFNQAAASTSTSTIKFIEAETLDIQTSITSNVGTINFTSGNITTGGNISAQDITATQTLYAGNIQNTTVIQNSTGNIQINAGTNLVDIAGGGFRIGSRNISTLSTAGIGEIVFTGDSYYAVVNDNGTGAAGPVAFPTFFSALGLQLPAFESADLPTAGESVEGMIAWDITNTQVVVFNGTSWVAV